MRKLAVVLGLMPMIFLACGSGQVKKSAAIADSGVVLTRGEEGSEFGRTYACKARYEAVQLPLGEKIERDGSNFSLTENRDKDRGRQKSVRLVVKLGREEGLPVFIINTLAHSTSPTLYPQSPLQVGMLPGGKGSFDLRTDTYADNYQNEGITDITLCLDRKTGAN